MPATRKKLQGMTVTAETASRTRTRSIANIPMAGRLVTGVYNGGAYIDLCFGDITFDVINVWDYAAGKPTIENTHRAVREAMREWKKAAGSSLNHDLREYAISVGLERP
jgi:hypothetical protein